MAAKPAHNTSDYGFTLVELLIVMAVVLLFVTLVLPRFEHLHMHADETSAISSVRLINQMQGQYRSAFPDRGYAGSLTALGGKAGSGTPNPQAAQLIPEDLASGNKSGYRFTVTNSATSDHPDEVHTYLLIAVPNIPGKSGESGFCSDQSGQIRFDPKGGMNCTELLQ